MAKVLVIGGGAAGLAAAYWARRDEHEVAVIEASPQWGGRTQTLRVDGHLLETGLEGFAPNPTALRELCLEIGVALAPRPELDRFVIQGGKHWPLPGGLDLSTGAGLHLLGKLPLSAGSRWKLGTERFGGASSAAEESLESFLSRRLGEEVWRVLEPAATAEWGGYSADLVAALAYPGLAALERGGLIQASRKVQPAPALVPAGGMGNLIHTLGQSLLEGGVKMYTRQEAVALAKQGGTWQVQTTTQVYSADAVVMALPAPQAAKIFRRTAPSFTTLINHFPHIHNAKVWQGYRVGDAPKAAGEWMIAQGQGFAGYRVAVRGPLNGFQTASVEFMGSSARAADATLSRLAAADLTKLWGEPAKPAASWVFRAPSSRPQYGVKHAQRVHDLEQILTHAPGLFLTGSYLAGPNLAQIVAHARATMGRALDYLLMEGPKALA